MGMPVRERHFHLNKLVDENNKIQEKQEEVSNKSKNKNIISGDELKQKFQTGELK
jgi:hypothetical protein